MKEAITIKNEQKVASSFVPYRENFTVRLATEDSVTLDTLSSGEKIYYEKIAEELKAKIYAKNAGDIFEGLANGEKVILSEDVTTKSVLTATKTSTIDLGGKKLSLPYDDDTIAGNIVVSGGELTLQNGSVEAESYVANVNGGKLIIKSGNYYSNSASVVQVSDGSCEIYGGTFRISDSAKEQWGTKYLLNVLDSKKGSAKITVYGGTFYGFNPAEDNKQEVEVAEGYKSVKSGDTYTVVKNED